MPKKVECQKGDAIGPYNILFVRDVAPYRWINKRGEHRSCRQCEFVCPVCGKNFITILLHVKNGHTTKCQDCAKNKYKLEGCHFGRLTVLKRNYSKTDKSKNKYWTCQCWCGNQIDVSSTDLIRKKVQSCSTCAQVYDITDQEFGRLTAKRFINSDYIIYQGQRFYKNPNIGGAQWVCVCRCGTIVVVPYSHLATGHTKSCGCLMSQGEDLIASILKELKYKYESQKTFEGCLSQKGRCLRFDFYISNLNCCIEYDGEQHFYSGTGWNTSENLMITQQRDRIKNEYCLKHNIRLIRIPYTQLSNINKDFIQNILQGNNISLDVQND